MRWVWAILVAALLVAGAGSPARAAQCGTASWYTYTGNPTATGEAFNGTSMTAAHRTLPFGTIVKVVDQRTGKSVVVRINDRGPAAWTGRIIDLSKRAATSLGFKSAGTAKVCISVLKKGRGSVARHVAKGLHHAPRRLPSLVGMGGWTKAEAVFSRYLRDLFQ